MKRIKNNTGFVLLLASLISGIVSIIGMVIFEITLKELTLSSGGRESQIAFYASDSGLECAIYWDLVGYVFDGDPNNDPDPNPRCNGQPLDFGSPSVSGDSTIYSFNVNFFPPTCAGITVSKILRRDSDGNILLDFNGDPLRRTYIQSRGYNTCDIDNPRRLERGLESRY